jgi:bacterial transferase hexapeptide repeat protein
MWKVGCFFGTGQELIEKAYQDSKVSGKYYEACVKFVEKIEEINNEK